MNNEQEPLKRIFLGLLIIALASFSFLTAILIIAKTSTGGNVTDNQEPTTPTGLFLGVSPTPIPNIKAIDLPKSETSSTINIEDVNLENSPTPTPTPITTQGDRNLIENPGLKLE